MPTLHASTAWMARRSYRNQSSADLAERKRILAEPYTEQARADKLAPVDAALKSRHAAAKLAIQASIQKAEEKYKELLPVTVQRLAALKNPERAIAVRELAKGVSADELVRLARAAASTNDVPAAFGLRLALSSLPATAFTQEQLTDFHASVDAIGTESQRDALADVIGARSQLVRLENDGLYLDPTTALFANPTDAARRADAMAIVDQGEGRTRSLPSAEVETLCRHAGVALDDD